MEVTLLTEPQDDATEKVVGVYTSYAAASDKQKAGQCIRKVVLNVTNVEEFAFGAGAGWLKITFEHQIHYIRGGSSEIKS